MTEEAFIPKFKLPPRRVAADDCEIVIDRKVVDGAITDEGTRVPIHLGEWVEVLPVQDLQTMLAWTNLQLGATGTSSEDAMLRLRELDGAMARMCERLAQVVTAWNWSDLASRPLPQPYGRPEVLAELSVEELMWLRSAAAGETAGERGNGSRASSAGSTATARSRKKR